MIVSLYVGDHLSGGQALAELVAANGSALEVRGVATRDVSTVDGPFEVGVMASSWIRWIQSSAVARLPRALLVEGQLAELLLVRGEERSLTEALRTVGDVEVLASVRRMDNHIVARYTEQLRQGRVTPLRLGDLQGRGVRYNLWARLEKWRVAVGSPAFHAHFCPENAPLADLAAGLVHSFGGDGREASSTPIGWPAGRTRTALSAEAAEALRRMNELLKEAAVPKRRALRAQAFELLTMNSVDAPPLRLPADAAVKLLQRFRAPMRELADCMSAEDAERFLSLESDVHRPLDEKRVRALNDQVLRALGLKDLHARGRTRRVPDRTGQAARSRLRTIVGLARKQQEAGHRKRYLRTVDRLRREIEALPETTIVRAPGADGSSAIPRRVLQYWEPMPPPDQMQPWMSSWDTIGMPGGEHHVASYDEGLAVMREAAGARGAEAFTRAPHPAARADLYRLAELLLRGGWYVDAEHEALLSTSDVLSWPVDHVFVRQPQGGGILNQFIGATPGSPVLRDVLNEACTNVLEGSGKTILHMTGPKLLTDHVLRYLDQPDASYALLPRNAVLNQVLHVVHNEADYKVRGHWRDHDMTTKERSDGEESSLDR